MSAAWSWSSLVIPKRDGPPTCILEVKTDLSTCPNPPNVGQVYRSLRPLEYKPADWSVDDWQEYFDERAGIAEFDGGLSRAEAEAQAFECCISRWLLDHPPTQADATICPHCHEPNGEIGRVTIATANGIWLHGACHVEWLKQRRQQAIIEMEIQHIQAGDTPHGN